MGSVERFAWAVNAVKDPSFPGTFKGMLAEYDVEVCDCQIHKAGQIIVRGAFEIQEVCYDEDSPLYKGWCEDEDGSVHWASFQVLLKEQEWFEDCYAEDEETGERDSDSYYNLYDDRNYEHYLDLRCTCQREVCAHSIALFLADHLGFEPFSNIRSGFQYWKLKEFFGPVDDRGGHGGEGSECVEVAA